MTDDEKVLAQMNTYSGTDQEKAVAFNNAFNITEPPPPPGQPFSLSSYAHEWRVAYRAQHPTGPFPWEH